ncbi:MAG TPA: recombinase family protein [Gemmataceae bacterium]|nr:recombinase family protein [Gemmataceae bacterium]
MSRRATVAVVAAPSTRCAIYTRKSSEEGLDQAFNSLDAQREAAEAYVASQRHDGWHAVATRYDDGGFSGGNTDRPALARLLADIEAGLIDCVVVYKVDRLSRSLLDFTRLMAAFDAKKVSFVSVTQQFNTGTSMGRLVLNVLLSFAQFEREIIAERTRDKLSAMRRKGMWAGGLPPLGYDIDPATKRLTINADEAARVRGIFALYREYGALLPVVETLRDRGWANKRTATRKGDLRGGKAFDRGSLYRLLTNVMYAGRVAHKGQTHAGEHEAIIPPAEFAEAQAHLGRNGKTGGAVVRNRYGSFLKGLLRCAACDAAMTPTHTQKKDGRRYRYYVCSAAQKNGHKTCPAGTVPAAAIEGFVVERLKGIGADPALVRETAAAARHQAEARLQELDGDRRVAERDLRAARAEVKGLSGKIVADTTGLVLQRLAEVQAATVGLEKRLAEIGAEVARAEQHLPAEDAVAMALGHFTAVWESLTPAEQARVVTLLVEGVEYDGAAETIEIAFHPAGLTALANEASTGVDA